MANKERLTASQEKVFDVLKYHLERGRVPSIRELSKETGFTSTSTIFMHLNSLEKKGYIVREKGINRSMRLTDDVNAVKVPVLGRIRAGNPILAVEEVEEYIPISSEVTKDENLFALRVVGDSMIKAGIFEGDIVVARKANDVHNGDIVIALVDGPGDDKEATVKRYLFEDNKIKLVPENDNYEIMIFDNVQIVGKVVSLVRNY